MGCDWSSAGVQVLESSASFTKHFKPEAPSVVFLKELRRATGFESTRSCRVSEPPSEVVTALGWSAPDRGSWIHGPKTWRSDDGQSVALQSDRCQTGHVATLIHRATLNVSPLVRLPFATKRLGGARSARSTVSPQNCFVKELNEGDPVWLSWKQALTVSCAFKAEPTGDAVTRSCSSEALEVLINDQEGRLLVSPETCGSGRHSKRPSSNLV